MYDDYHRLQNATLVFRYDIFFVQNIFLVWRFSEMHIFRCYANISMVVNGVSVNPLKISF